MKKFAFAVGLGLGVMVGILAGVLSGLDQEETIAPETNNYWQQVIMEARRAAKAQKETMEKKLAEEIRHPA